MNRFSVSLAAFGAVLMIGGCASIQTPTENRDHQPNTALGHYDFDNGISTKLDGIPGGFIGNASGIAYNSETDSYFIIRNKASEIVEYGWREGEFSLLRKIAIESGIDNDWETISSDGNSQFTMANEANEIISFTIPSDRNITTIYLSSADLQYLPGKGTWNSGIEGITHAPSYTEDGSMYACQESGPMKVLLIKPDGEGGLTATEPFDAEAKFSDVITDISECFYDAESGHLLVLSDESASILEVNEHGDILAQQKLKGHNAIFLQEWLKGAGLFIGDVQQYEGLTIGRNGELVLVSEPNRVEIFQRKVAATRQQSLISK